MIIIFINIHPLTVLANNTSGINFIDRYEWSKENTREVTGGNSWLKGATSHYRVY